MVAENVKTFYHCTVEGNLGGILNDGLKPGCDGYVYLASNPIDSAKFILIRGVPLEDIVVIGIPRNLLDETKLDISEDHSINFFNCEAYTYKGTIYVGNEPLVSKLSRKGDN